VLTIDLRNHGESGHAPSMQYKEMVHDVITLLDKLNIAKAHFLGNSMGARVTMSLALLHVSCLLVSYRSGDILIT